MDKSTKINGPIFQISKIRKKNRNNSYPSKITKKMFKIVSNEKNNKKTNNNEDKKKKQIMSIIYQNFPVVKNEEESDYYYLLKKDDDNCEKDISTQRDIFQFCHNDGKKKSRNDDASAGVGGNDNEEIDLIITNEKNIQSSCPINSDIKKNDKNDNPLNTNNPINSSKINNLIKEESKFKYLNKDIIIIDKKKMNENLEEKQNVELDEEKVAKDALDAFMKEEKERIKKSKEDKLERLKRKAEKEEEIKLKSIEEEAEVRKRRLKTETEMKKIKFREDILLEQENEFQIVDEYVKKELENICIKRKKEALNEKLRKNIDSQNNQKKTISLREESDNEEPKKNEEKKK